MDFNTNVPLQVTMRQARLALLADGALDLVAPLIDAMPSPDREKARIEWEYSQAVKRDSAFVLQLAPALGYSTAEEIDALFSRASAL